VLVVRIKELRNKIAGAPSVARDEKDPRYISYNREALVLYFGCAAQSAFVARRPSPIHGDGCGDPAPVRLP
jgi:hypothetical protein